MPTPLSPVRALALIAVILGGVAISACSPEEHAVWQQFSTAHSARLAQLVPVSGGPGEYTLDRLRNCESGGDYRAVSSSGRYRGAYQFSRSTWNNVARSYAPLEVGTDPAAAGPVVQDHLARALWSQNGPRSWPVCGPRSA